jgi:hypothetical protein
MFKDILMARKLRTTIFWDINNYGGIYATRDHNNVRIVLQNTKNSVQGHSE